MQVIKSFPPQVKEWKHRPTEDFEKKVEEPAEQYTLEITPPLPGDKDILYFDVTVEKQIINARSRMVPFHGIIYYHFKVKTNNETITPEFCFSVIRDAAGNFAAYFQNNTRKNNLKGYKLKKPEFELLQKQIEKAIDIWKNKQ